MRKFFIVIMIFLLGSVPALANDQVTHSEEVNGQVKTTTTFEDNTPIGKIEGKISLTQSKEEALRSEKQFMEQEDALVKCQKYSFKGPHPLFNEWERHVQIHGVVDGKCLYTETMPNNGLLSCKLTEAQRQEVSAKGWANAFNTFANNSDTCQISGY